MDKLLIILVATGYVLWGNPAQAKEYNSLTDMAAKIAQDIVKDHHIKKYFKKHPGAKIAIYYSPPITQTFARTLCFSSTPLRDKNSTDILEDNTWDRRVISYDCNIVIGSNPSFYFLFGWCGLRSLLEAELVNYGMKNISFRGTSGRLILLAERKFQKSHHLKEVVVPKQTLKSSLVLMIKLDNPKDPFFKKIIQPDGKIITYGNFQINGPNAIYTIKIIRLDKGFILFSKSYNYTAGGRSKEVYNLVK